MSYPPQGAEVAALTAIAEKVDYKVAIHFDAGGSAGTAYPIGTYQSPVNNLPDLRTIAAARNIKTIIVHGPLTLDAAMNGYEFIGFNPANDADFIDINGQDIDNSSFFNLFIQGAMGGTGYYPFFKDCIFGVITDFKGFAMDCVLYSITLAAGADVDFWNPSVQWGGGILSVGAPSAFLYGFKGELQITNMTGGTLTIFGSEGYLIIRNTCTGGAITIYGDTRVNDESGAGCTVTIYGPGQESIPISVNAIAASETNVLRLQTTFTRNIVRSLRLKCEDPGANIVTVRLYEQINDVGNTLVDSFDITNANFGTYHSLMDMFGLPHLAGDILRVSVQASAGGPYAVIGQYSFESH